MEAETAAAEVALFWRNERHARQSACLFWSLLKRSSCRRAAIVIGHEGAWARGGNTGKLQTSCQLRETYAIESECENATSSSKESFVSASVLTRMSGKQQPLLCGFDHHTRDTCSSISKTCMEEAHRSTEEAIEDMRPGVANCISRNPVMLRYLS